MPSSTTKPEQHSSISVTTLLIASAASVVAAIVVSRIWGPGTLIGAAVTPVIVTLVSEGLRKPAEVITVVRTTADTQVHQPGRPRRRDVAPDHLQTGDTVVAAPSAAVARVRRPAVVAALVTGLIAFALGAFVLTSTELVFGDAASGGGGTTLFTGGGSGRSSSSPEKTTTPTTSTATETTTTTAPAKPTTPTTPTGKAPGAVPPAGTTGATGATSGATVP